MKRAIFALFAALALVFAMPAVAQQEETQDPELEAYETRTQPNADSHAPHSGLTITGTIEEVNDEQLALRTTTGIEHIQLMPRTEKPVDLQVGQNVSVDYTRTGQGIMIAQKIRTEGAVTDEGTTTTATTGLTAETEPMDETEPMEADADLTAETDTELDAESDFDANAGLQADVETENEWETETDVATDLDTGNDDDLGADNYEQESALPATGSELPLLALLGLLSVAAAFGVRSFVR